MGIFWYTKTLLVLSHFIVQGEKNEICTRFCTCWFVYISRGMYADRGCASHTRPFYASGTKAFGNRDIHSGARSNAYIVTIAITITFADRNGDATSIIYPLTCANINAAPYSNAYPHSRTAKALRRAPANMRQARHPRLVYGRGC